MSAKKATKEKDGKAFEKAGQGKKYCQNCSEIIAGRAMTCPHCQTEQTPRGNAANKPKASKGNGFAGEIKRALETLEGAKEAQSLIDRLGGLEKAQAVLEVLAGKDTPRRNRRSGRGRPIGGRSTGGDRRRRHSQLRSAYDFGAAGRF